MSMTASSREDSEKAFLADVDERHAYDLAILGSGIACTHTLHQTLAALPRGSKPARIAVLDNGGEFWRGFPYGRRSSPNSLIITTFQEFVPDAEHAEFSAWLTERRSAWTRRLRDHGGEAAVRWLADNGAAIEAGAWDKLYIPRQLYGDFAEEKIRAAIAEARASGKAIVDELAGEAVDIRRDDRRFAIACELDGRPQTISAKVALIASGSPPFRPLDGAEAARDRGLYVNNVYLPGLVENLETLRTRLAEAPEPSNRNLLVVGSNATSLEVIYMIARDTRLQAVLNKMVVLSTGGTLPHRMTEDRREAYAFPRMLALLDAGSITPRAIIEAVEADFDVAAQSAENIGDMFHDMSEQLVRLLDRLDDAAQREFHHAYGMRFTRIVRRAGAEYRDAAQGLIDSGKLELVAGAFNRINSEAAGRLQLEYSSGGEKRLHPLGFSAVFNCAGFEDVSAQSSSRLLASIVRGRLAKVNPTGRGFEVDETFAASPNLFVCGPLLGGVFNRSVRFWHVENVRRIQAVSLLLGPVLAQRVSETSQQAGTTP